MRTQSVVSPILVLPHCRPLVLLVPTDDLGHHRRQNTEGFMSTQQIRFHAVGVDEAPEHRLITLFKEPESNQGYILIQTSIGAFQTRT